jgi:hypothetical protein
MKDIIRTGSLQPPNPILKSLPSKTEETSNDDTTTTTTTTTTTATTVVDPSSFLPQFSCMLPYHLENATQEVTQQ